MHQEFSIALMILEGMRGTGKTTLCSILQKVGGTLGHQCHYFFRTHVLDLLLRINICAEALRGLVVKL